MLNTACRAGRRSRKHAPIPYPLSLITLLAAVALAGCAMSEQPDIAESNYLTYHHPFTDAAAQATRQNAEKICAERKQVALQYRSSQCSLEECTTHYQCMDKN
jgi:hypothetical protein